MSEQSIRISTRSPASTSADQPSRRTVLGGGTALATLSLLAPSLFPVAARAEEKIIKSHAFSEMGDIKYPEGFAHFDYVNPDAPKGGELSYAAQGTFDSFNPFTRQGRAGARAGDQYETLMISSYDEPDTTYGLVAESLEYPESQDWVIFNIRPGVKFSDGSDVTAEDVVFSHNILLEQGLKSYAEAVKKRIPKAEALGTLRVKFYFAPDIPRRSLISQVAGTPVMSKAWFEKTGARIDKSRMEPGIGSGPYVLDHYEINQSIVYRRNPDYWGDKINVNIGRNNFDRIRIEYFADSNAALEAFKAGTYTLRSENSSKSWASAYDFPALERGDVIKDAIPDGNVPPAVGFVMNMDRPQFQDVRLREAVQLAYNFEWTNASLQYGLFKQRNSFWEGSDLEAKGVPEGDELAVLKALGDLVDPALLTDSVVMAHTSDKSTEFPRGNRRRASRLLEAAGWSVGDEGKRRNAKGELLTIEFLSDNPSFDRIISPFIANLKTLGIDANYNRIDSAQFTARRRDRDFDMINGGYRSSLVPSTGLYQMFGTEASAYSVFNPSGIHGPAIETLIDRIVGSDTRDELIPNVRALDRILRARRFMVPTWYLGKYWEAYFNMYEYPENLPPYNVGIEDLWWIDAKKAADLKTRGVLR